MGDYYTRRHEHEHHGDDSTFAAAEVLAAAMLISANRLAEAIESLALKEPEWATKLEARMGAVEDALARVEENLAGLTDEIGQVVTVITDLQNQVENPAVAAQLGDVADRLQAAKDTLEGATTLDDPVVDSNPPEPDAPPADAPPADAPPADAPPAEEPPAEPVA